MKPETIICIMVAVAALSCGVAIAIAKFSK